MKKKLIIALAAALVLGCLGIGAWAAANYGTESDPLVAMSYLTGVETRLEREFNAALDEAVGDLGVASGAFESVSLSESGVTLGLGAEVLCLESGARATGTLVDATAGGVLNAGQALEANHLYIVADSGTVLAGQVTALVRGEYTAS